MPFAGKVCVVTGASSGIGRATALAFAARGARVVVAARRRDRLETLLAELPGEGHGLLVTDVSRRADAAALAAHVAESYGRCDVLVNNAGFAGEASLFDEGAVESLEAIMATNFFGTVYCTAAMLPLLTASAPSHLVNVASIAGRLAVPGSPAYTASKFAVVGWSEALSYELALSGIHTTIIEPGMTPTEGFRHESSQTHRYLRHALVTAEEVAAAIVAATAARKHQRVVPRWYYLLQVPRLLTPRLWRTLAAKVAAARQDRSSGF